MLYKKLLKLSRKIPALIPILQRYAEQRKPSLWKAFLKEEGKKKTPNTNPDTREQFPQVEIWTAAKNDPKAVWQLYQQWLKRKRSLTKKEPIFKLFKTHKIAPVKGSKITLEKPLEAYIIDDKYKTTPVTILEGAELEFDFALGDNVYFQHTPKDSSKSTQVITHKDQVEDYFNPQRFPIKPSFQAKWVDQSPEGIKAWGKQFDYNFDRNAEETLASYSDEGYNDLNDLLRRTDKFKGPIDPKKHSNIPNLKHAIEDLDRAFKQAQVPENLKVVRKISYKHPLVKKMLEGYLQPGSTCKDPGFMSTSIRENFLWENYVMHISVPKGYPGIYMGDTKQEGLSANAYENELLLPRNTTLRVLSLDPKNKKIMCEIIVKKK